DPAVRDCERRADDVSKFAREGQFLVRLPPRLCREPEVLDRLRPDNLVPLWLRARDCLPLLPARAEAVRRLVPKALRRRVVAERRRPRFERVRSPVFREPCSTVSRETSLFKLLFSPRAVLVLNYECKVDLVKFSKPVSP